MPTKKEIIWSIVALLVATAALLINIIIYVNYKTSPSNGGIVPSEIQQQMKYPGVQVLYEDWNGVYYFYRNGRKVRI